MSGNVPGMGFVGTEAAELGEQRGLLEEGLELVAMLEQLLGQALHDR